MAAKATKYIQHQKTGKMLGSVGEGRDLVPSTAGVTTTTGTNAGGDDVSLTSAVATIREKLTPEQKLAKAEESLLTAIESLSTEEGFKAALDFAARVPGYSFGNNLLLMMEHLYRVKTDPNVPANPGYFMSFNKWKEVGRSVVKGASGYPILAPKTVSGRWYVKNGERIYLKKGERAPAGFEEYRGQGITGFTVVFTFPQYLTDGDPVPEMPKPKLLEGETLPGLDDTVTDLITEAGFTLEYIDRADDPTLRGGANGYTEWATKRIVVCKDLPSDFARSKTLLHEYGHMSMHGLDGEARSEHSGLKEVQAEATAYLVFASLADMDTSDYSVPYTAGWLSSVSTDPKKRMREAQRAINAMGKVATAVTDRYQSTQMLVEVNDDLDPTPDPEPALAAA